MKTVTLKQIAEKLGVSVTTVSKALKDYPDISENTKQIVKNMAKSMNFVPNASAVYLRTQESKTIGVVIPALVHHFFSKVIDGILNKAEKSGYLVILMQSNENYELEKKQIDLLLKKGVDGILISLSNNTNNFDHLKRVQEYNIPLILFDKIAKTVNCSKVVIDDRKAAYDAVTHLINKGHRRIAHFRGDLNPQNSIDRFLGYKKALEDHGISYDPSLVYICNKNSDFKDGYKTAAKLIEDHQNTVDAVFTITDAVAIGAMKYFSDHSITVPDEIAVFGFSNWFMSSVTNPPLSTVKQPGYKMGKKATQLLLNEIENKKSGISSIPQKIILPTELIIRATCS
ncbi:LacI family DNA-binding transcriptional regulator [Kordia zhangzhouensis]|uniref:LacI family DNA-binding transcriptional regulator n=1 Tax=Kordia zhangzhouensis TaxID=1620405 RepID=UPI000629943E|nr:LacI family DNA-binding transcriptional regulator [Kordia zhangzhouensis]